MLYEPGKGGVSAPPDLAKELPVICNVSDETLGENIRAAYKRELPIVDFIDPHKGIALLVGGGPSLANDLDEIKNRQQNGETVFALNGAGLYLSQNGIIPDAEVMLDARPFNAKFIVGLPLTTKLYLAMQCSPEVFEAGKEHQIITWHAANGGLSGIVEERPAAFICGGTVVGIRAMHLVCVLGYREMHLFGYDSSLKEGENHAYKQPENDADRQIECTVRGRKFFAAPWMIRQADDFQIFSHKLTQVGVFIGVHGSGLLPWIAKSMLATDIYYATYDLKEAPASWDFTTWLVAADMMRKRQGSEKLKVQILADEFRQDALPMSMENKLQMLEHVIYPALELIGAEITAEHGERHAYVNFPIVKMHEQGTEITKFRAPEGAVEFVRRRLGQELPVVITLREAEYWPQRNSNYSAWVRFAKEQNAIIVRDTKNSNLPIVGVDTFPEASTDLHIRAALYERAALNMIVSNGPANLLWFSNSAFLQFKMQADNYPCSSDEWYRTAIGIEPGAQMPWFKPTQRFVWDTDDYEVIVREYRKMAITLMAAQLEPVS